MSHENRGTNADNLRPDNTDMLVEFLCNSDKMIDQEKRWKFADHRNSPDSSAMPGAHGYTDSGHRHYDDELDEGVDNYISDKDHNGGVFSKAERAERADREGRSERKTESETDTDRRESFGPNAFDAGESMSKEDLVLKKLNMLRKLGELKQAGIKLSQNYGLDSDLKMMEYEYKLHSDIRSKQQSVQWMGHMLVGIIKGTELLNDNYNPFDVKLDGLTTKISSDMNSYYSVLGEIYEKYNQPGKQMAPELKLLMMITGAALSLNMNRALPGLMGGIANSVQNDDTIKKQLRDKATAESHPQPNANSDQGHGKAQNQTNKPVSYADVQHAIATQKMKDLQLVKENKAQVERLTQQVEKLQKEKGFVLSSEMPESDKEERHFSKDELEAIKRERMAREVSHLESLKQKAKISSQAYRSGSSLDQGRRDPRYNDLERQSKNLEEILGSLEDGHVDQEGGKRPERKVNHPERNIKPKKSKRKDTDNRSTISSASTTSFNPNADKIVNSTRHKLKYEQIDKDSISFGSADKGKKKGDNITVKFGTENPNQQIMVKSKKSDESSSITGSHSKENADYGMISFGSAKKGTPQTFATGKK